MFFYFTFNIPLVIEYNFTYNGYQHTYRLWYMTEMRFFVPCVVAEPCQKNPFFYVRTLQKTFEPKRQKPVERKTFKMKINLLFFSDRSFSFLISQLGFSLVCCILSTDLLVMSFMCYIHIHDSAYKQLCFTINVCFIDSNTDDKLSILNLILRQIYVEIEKRFFD